MDIVLCEEYAAFKIEIAELQESFRHVPPSDPWRKTCESVIARLKPKIVATQAKKSTSPK